jgi:hypothetical protein
MKRSLFFLFSFGFAACALPESPDERADEAAPDGEDATAEAALPSVGVNNKVLTLDGSGDTLSTASYTAIEPSGSLTIEAWIHPTAVTGTRTIVNNVGRYRLLLDGDKPRLCVATTLSGTTTEKCNTFSTITVPANNWSFLAAVFNNNANSVTARLYKSDLTETTATITGVDGNLADANSADNAVHFGEGFAGVIDEVRIWTDARTANQTKNGRKQNLDCGLSKLGGYWRLDGSADESCGQATGTLNGNAVINNTANLLDKNCAARGKNCVCDVHADCNDGAALGCNGTTCQLTKSCDALRDAHPSLPSGTYPIQMGSLGQQTVYCDQESEGGGWTLVLGYNHAANTSLATKPDDIPESPSANSHMSTAMLKALNDDGNADTRPFTEMRFYCETSGHTRKIHFNTTNTGAIDYILGTAGNNVGYWTADASGVTGHSGILPGGTAHVVNTSVVDQRMNYMPFYNGGQQRWTVGHHGIYGDSSWSCDDYVNNQNTTQHRVWVR